MSKSNVKGEKIQIVAFSTNESEHNPNDLLNIYLENNNHLIIKKTSFSTAFTTTLPNTSKQTKIMICSVLNLSKEYTGIKDVNCYLCYVDLEKEDSKEKFDIILNYAKENCDLNKKVYLFGMITKKGNKKLISKDYIDSKLEDEQIFYEYKEINVEEKMDICDSLRNVFNYSLSNPLSGEIKTEDKNGEESGSCNIF